MSTKIVKPKTGFVVVDPYGRIVPEDGATVKWSAYWERRLRDGEIIVAGQKPTRKKTKVEEK